MIMSTIQPRPRHIPCHVLWLWTDTAQRWDDLPAMVHIMEALTYMPSLKPRTGTLTKKIKATVRRDCMCRGLSSARDLLES